MKRAISSLNLTESNLLCSIENLKQNLINAEKGKLNQYLIDQLNSVKSDIDKLINRQSNNPSKEEKASPVNCQLCFQEQTDIFELREHLKSSCQAIDDPDIKETKKNSAFQILASNFIKCKICNVFLNDFEGMIRHRQLESHLSAKKKNSTHFSKFLYCSACYINVPDNVVQFENHIANEVHIDRCLESKKLKGDDVPRNVLLKEGFQFLLRADNTTKCLLCNSEFEMTNNQLDIHRNSSLHVKTLKESDNKSGQDCLKCLVCDEKITGLIPIILHLKSPGHEKKAKAGKQTKPPVVTRECLFCNANCKNIQALAKHQKEKCPKLMKKDEKSLKPNDEQWIFQCMICGFQTSSRNLFKDHTSSKDHKTQLTKLESAGFEVVQDTCIFCKLDYIGPSSVRQTHADHKLDKTEVPKKVRSRSKSLSSRKLLENIEVEEKEKNPKKAESTFPVFLSGFSELPSIKNLQKKLSIFGGIDSIDVSPSKDVIIVCFNAKSSAENVLSLKELTVGNSIVNVTNKEPPNNGLKLNVEEVRAAIMKSSTVTKSDIKPSLGDLYNPSDFDQRFLINPKMILDCSHTLCKISNSYSNAEKNNEIGIICKHILNGSSFTIYGSYAYDLNMRDCALDIFVSLPGFKVENNPRFDLVEKTLFKQFISALENCSGFDNVKEIDRTVSNFPYISCRKVDSKMICNISFSNLLVIEKTEILKDQIGLDKRVRPLLLLVKAWAHDKQLIDQNKFSSYAIFMMVIFFLQSDDIKILPRYNERTNSPILQSFFKKQGSNLGGTEFKTENTMSISQLFIQFLKFYTKFDYDEVLCLPFCQHFPKSTFANEPAFKDSPLCIMDLLEPKVNLAKNVSASTLQDFLGYGLCLLKNF